MGFSLQGLDPPEAPYALSNAVTLVRFPYDANAASPLQGFAHLRNPDPGPGV
jgi:hypothetical protein